MADRDARKPSKEEDEYFAAEDVLKKKKLALKVKSEMEVVERKRLKELHFMHCPKCGQDMHEVDYHDVDVDVCFSCGGIFLDRGELETIVKKQSKYKGVMPTILNWFKAETKRPVKAK